MRCSEEDTRFPFFVNARLSHLARSHMIGLQCMLSWLSQSVDVHPSCALCNGTIILNQRMSIALMPPCLTFADRLLHLVLISGLHG